MKRSITLLFAIIFIGCNSESNKTVNKIKENQPNVLWLIAEDMSPYLAAFGDSTISTPNIDRLVSEGVKYTNVFSPSGVCAPSRAAIATGMYPSSIGANHMRTASHTEKTGLPKYEAVPPVQVKMFNQLLREGGYYTTNNSKQDYQFNAPKGAWDDSSPYAHWRNRDEEQSFFSVFSFMTTHESGLFEPYGILKNELRLYQAGDTTYQMGHPYAKTSIEETPIHIPKDTKFEVPPYLPDTPTVQRDLWKMYNNIAEMDKQVGAILDQLEADGLLDDTVIFFFSDHGGPLPRQKRLIYDSGLQVPMVVRFPDKKNAGTTDDQLISFVDFAPTVLGLAQVESPDYLQGRDFLDDKNKRKYIHAAADRFDGHTDVIRAVRDKRFKYIRNYRPEQGYYLPIAFRENIPTMKELLKLNEENKLTQEQALWFRTSKTAEELFDCENDPHELNNLATNPEYQETLQALKEEMDRWLTEIGDNPEMPERELITQLWNGDDEQPKTEDPIIEVKEGYVYVKCKTVGATIAYKNAKDKAWRLYQEPISVALEKELEFQAHRLGFLESEILTYKNEGM